MKDEASTAQVDSWDSRTQNIANAIGTSKETVTTILTTLGYEPETALEMLDDDEVTKFGDFREAFKVVDEKEVPLIKLRLAFKFAKASKKAEDRKGVDPRAVQLRELGFKVKLEDASLAVLLPLYDPSLPNDPVTRALASRFGDRAVIAFNADGKVALNETIDYAFDLEQGMSEQEAIMVDGELSPLYPVGRVPDLIVDEDPLFPGQPLRKGRSMMNHRNWTEIKHENRQLIRIVVERGEIDTEDRDAVLRLMERATDLDKLKEAYPEAWMTFRTRKKAETLPTLKMQFMSWLKSATKPNNPFSHRKH